MEINEELPGARLDPNSPSFSYFDLPRSSENMTDEASLDRNLEEAAQKLKENMGFNTPLNKTITSSKPTLSFRDPHFHEATCFSY